MVGLRVGQSAEDADASNAGYAWRCFMLGLPLLLGLVVLLGLPASPALADYAPSHSSYYNYDPALIVGPNGTWMLASSALPSSYMALSDAQGHYTARTGFSRVLVPTGPTDCGNTQGCVLFDVYLTSLDWVPSCTTRDVTTSVTWATTYVSADAYNNTFCTGLGSDYAPVWVVAIKPSNVQNDWYGYQHVVRHEVGHALGLGEASASCWTEVGITGYLPLMNQGPCPAPYRNYYLTDNEVSTIISLNDWH